MMKRLLNIFNLIFACSTILATETIRTNDSESTAYASENLYDDPRVKSLHEAAFKGYKDDVLEKLANPMAYPVDLRTLTTDETPLHMAAAGGQKEIVEILLNHAADVNAQNKKGDTPLILAIKHRNVQLAKYLLTNKKIKINRANNDGATALIYAIENNLDEIIEILLNLGADVNPQNKDGDTPLILAIKQRNVQLAKDLLAIKKIKINRANKYYTTALIYAIVHDLDEIALELINRPEININHISHVGTEVAGTAMDIAQYNEKIANALKERGGVAVIPALEQFLSFAHALFEEDYDLIKTFIHPNSPDLFHELSEKIKKSNYTYYEPKLLPINETVRIISPTKIQIKATYNSEIKSFQTKGFQHSFTLEKIDNTWLISATNFGDTHQKIVISLVIIVIMMIILTYYAVRYGQYEFFWYYEYTVSWRTIKKWFKK